MDLKEFIINVIDFIDSNAQYNKLVKFLENKGFTRDEIEKVIEKLDE